MSKRTRIKMQSPTESPLPLSMIEKRMAFYAGYLKGGKLTLSEEEAAEWLRDLPKDIEGQ